MKTLSMVVVLSFMVGLVGCGTASSNCPSGQIENEQGECVDIPIPCSVDADCSNDGSLICTNRECASFLTKDVCYTQQCADTCQACGDLTNCYEGVCQSSCDVFTNMRILTAIEFCNEHEEYKGCSKCMCYQQWKEEENGNCVDPDPACWEGRAKLRKTQDYTTVVNEIDFACR